MFQASLEVAFGHDHQFIASEPQLSPSTFSLFSSLPTELRLQIWSLVPPPPRVVRAHYCHKAGRLKPLTPPPALLITCAESRAELLSTMGWVLACGTPANKASVCVNFAIDAVQLNWEAIQYGAVLRNEDLLATRHLEIRCSLVTMDTPEGLVPPHAPALESQGAAVRVVWGVQDFENLETLSLVTKQKRLYHLPGLLRGRYDFPPLFRQRYDSPGPRPVERENGMEKMSIMEVYWKTKRHINRAVLSSGMQEEPLANVVFIRKDGSRFTEDGEFIREWARVGGMKIEAADFRKEDMMEKLDAMRTQRRSNRERGKTFGGQA